MQTSIDCFVAGANGEMDWMVWDWDDELKNHIAELTKNVDLILLGRKLAENFIDVWESRAKDAETNDDFTRKMNDSSKIVFSKSLEKADWKNTSINNGDLIEEINKLKNSDGGDIIVYGGGNFVSSLTKNNLIDEYHLFVNPVALGQGMTIFGGLNEKLNLKLTHSKSFSCEVVALGYAPN